MRRFKRASHEIEDVQWDLRILTVQAQHTPQHVQDIKLPVSESLLSLGRTDRGDFPNGQRLGPLTLSARLKHQKENTAPPIALPQL